MKQLAVMAFLMVSFCSVWADPLKIHEAVTRQEKELDEFVRQLYKDVASENEEHRRKTLGLVMAKKKDFEFLFDDNAELLWGRAGEKIDMMIEKASLMKGRTRKYGYVDNIITGIELINLRENEKYHEFIELIPENVAAYRVVTHRRKGKPNAVSGPYLFVEGRWLWMSNIDYVPRALKHLKKKSKDK